MFCTFNSLIFIITGAILIFVPGLANIRDLTDLLKKSKEIYSSGIREENLRILPLHSTLSSAEQSRVFTVFFLNCFR